MVRRVLLVAALAAIVVTRLEPRLLRMPFIDRAPLAAAFAREADGNWPEYPRFIGAVRALTQPGDSVALVIPSLDWGTYSDAYYRASYLLTGREVLPIVDTEDRMHPENLRRARYIAAWHARGSLPAGYAVVWRGEGGVLLRH